MVLVADHIGVDAGGKLNALGAALTLTGVQPNGFTPPQSVAAVIDVPSRHAGAEFAVLLELRNETADTVVQLPGPSGKPEALRIQQLVQAKRPQVQGAYVPESMFCRVQVMLNFANGLPLAPSTLYAWRLEVDGQHRKGWRAQFYVPGPPPAPVVGGPAGPSGSPTA